MAFKFNVFTSNFDIVEGGTNPFWLPPVTTRANLPSGDPDGACRVVLDEDIAFVYDSGAMEWHNSRLSEEQFNSSANAAGISIDSVVTSGVVDYRINLHKADETNPGGVSIDAQTFGGDKTFADNVVVTGDLTVNGTETIINTETLDVEDANITINKNGNDISAEGSGLTIERSGVDGSVVYEDALASKFKAGSAGSEIEIANVSSAQDITNKNLKSNTNLITGAKADNLERETGSESVISIPDATAADSMVLEAHPQSVTNKDLKSNTNLVTGAKADNLERETGNEQVLTLPDTTAADTIVTEAHPQTLSNKTINNSNSIIIEDANLTIQDDVDNTKQLKLEVAAITTATTRTLSVPDADDTIVVEALAQTLTNKSMDGDDNTFTDISITSLKTEAADANKFIERDGSGAVISGKAVPTGDVVGTTDTQTLTNKSIDSDNNTITNIVNADIKAGAAINATKIADGSVDNSEFEALDGVTSSIQDQLDNKVDGPASSTDEALARFDATTGKLVQDSVGILTDAGALSGLTQLDVDNVKIDGNTISSTDTDGDLLISPDGSGDIDASTSVIKNVVDPSNDQDAATKKYVDDNTSHVPGDLDLTSFAMANNQAVFQNVTGVAFANGVTRSAELEYSIVIDATADLYESGKILAIQRGAGWDVSQSVNGDNSQIILDMDSTGQLQYKSANFAGFVSGTIKVRATTTSV